MYCYAFVSSFNKDITDKGGYTVNINATVVMYIEHLAEAGLGFEVEGKSTDCVHVKTYVCLHMTLYIGMLFMDISQ